MFVGISCLLMMITNHLFYALCVTAGRKRRRARKVVSEEPVQLELHAPPYELLDQPSAPPVPKARKAGKQAASTTAPPVPPPRRARASL